MKTREMVYGFLLVIAVNGMWSGKVGCAEVSDLAADSHRGEVALRNEYLRVYSQRKFAPFYSLMHDELSPAQKLRLQEILADREIALADLPQKSAAASLTPEGYREWQTKQTRDRITAECGAKIAEAVERYLQTLPARRVVGELNQLLIYRHEGMSIAQMESLCRVLQAHDVSMGTRQPGPADLTRYITAKQKAAEMVVGEAAQFLSPGQIAALAADLDLQVAFLRSNQTAISHPGAGNGRIVRPQ